MRTTVSIQDELLVAAKERAARLGVTLGHVVETALRRELTRAPDAEAPPLPVFRGGTGPRPGVELTSSRALAELLDDGVALDRRR